MTATNSGRTMDNMVPKRLVAGTPVVVYIKPNVRIGAEDAKAGIVVGKWFKAQFRYWHLNGPVVKLRGELRMLEGSSVIVVRSTSWKDSIKKATIAKRKRAVK